MSDMVIRVDDNSGIAHAFDAKSLSPDPRLPREDSRTSAITSEVSSNICTTTSFPAGLSVQAFASQHFIPRPFPPPNLAHVPVEYIVDQLHNLAPNYWSKPETADCTIIIPLSTVVSSADEQVSRPSNDPPESLPYPLCNSSDFHVTPKERWPSPSGSCHARMVMRLHSDYLSAHSKLLCDSFGGALPIDFSLRPPSGYYTPMPSISHPSKRSSQPFASRLHPFNGMPRLLPSAPSHPVLLLPVPDPLSIRILIHYMYFGSTVYLEDALDREEVSWEGVARNVEYLGMGLEIKVFLGRWYNRWKHGGDFTCEGDEYDSEDSYDSEDEDVEYFDHCSHSSATSICVNCEDEMDLEEDFKKAGLQLEPSRGRNRAVRRLGHATSDPTLQASFPQHESFIPLSPRGRSE